MSECNEVEEFEGSNVTSEVCLMNRLGVVLAADSATTVKYWNGNAEEVRYFKGANKIFQLSESQPVGIMIYNAVDALRVPWEVIIKEFRRELGGKTFNTIQGYADEFIAFLNRDQRLFPADARKAEFEEVLGRAILKFLIRFLEDKKASKVSDLAAFFADAAANSTVLQSEIKFDLANVSQLRQIFGPFSQAKFSEWLAVFTITYSALNDVEIDYLISIALREVRNTSPSTGLVIAGFGDHSVFPEVVHLKSCQFWFDQFSEFERVCEGTSYDVPALVSGYAQTSMIDTLRLGFSDDVLGSLASDARAKCSDLVDQVASALGGTVADADRTKLVDATVDKMVDGLFDHAWAQHALPLRRVVGVLPLDEMSTLAETLINLQSLKEKVTKPSETVGGPVDVAAITRAEGLVWVKRKHYFSPEINSRYFERRGRA